MVKVDKKIKVLGLPKGWSHASKLGACIRVTGEDALTFIQGQFTQELRFPASQTAAYGLWLNQKGKVLADSFVLKESIDNLLIISFYSNSDLICERLEAYIIADDVTLTDETATWQGMAVGGVEAAAWLVGQAGEMPAAGMFVHTKGGFLFPGRRGAEPSWEWILPASAALPEGLEEIQGEQIERLRISAGIPKVPVDIGPGQLPNEGGLEESAISYTKGCYLGQEVMARLKAMGQVRRKLVRVRAEGHPPPSVPCPLLQGEKRVGELSSAVSDGEGGFMGLALVSRLGLDPAALLAPRPGGEAYIQLVDIP